jgi:hypothetical protein
MLQVWRLAVSLLVPSRPGNTQGYAGRLGTTGQKIITNGSFNIPYQ